MLTVGKEILVHFRVTNPIYKEDVIFTIPSNRQFELSVDMPLSLSKVLDFTPAPEIHDQVLNIMHP